MLLLHPLVVSSQRMQCLQLENQEKGSKVCFAKTVVENRNLAWHFVSRAAPKLEKSELAHQPQTASVVSAALLKRV